jgi:hypothetical protein
MEDAYTSTMIAAGDEWRDACRLLVTRVTSVLWRRHNARGVYQSRRMQRITTRCRSNGGRNLNLLYISTQKERSNQRYAVYSVTPFLCDPCPTSGQPKDMRMRPSRP